MLELLFLLLPVAVAYGWVMGKQNANKDNLEQQINLNKAINSSVSLLLNHKEEKVFDKLIQYFDDSPTNTENYLTLAKLFRKKGETDKAIAIHQGLVDTDQIDIPEHQMEVIKLELAEDFISAGMLLRALDISIALLNSAHANEALLQALHIFEQTRDWQKGIDAYNQTKGVEIKEEGRRMVSHFYCELADASDSLKFKMQSFNRALKVHDDCMRSRVSLAKLFANYGNISKSQELIIQILELEPSFAPALFNIAPECFINKETQAAWLAWLIREKKISSVAVHNQMAEYIVKEQGVESARKYIVSELVKVPSVRGFAKLIELEKEFFMSAPHFEQLILLINQYIELKPNYECKCCGYSSKQFDWRCPACHQWQTIKPLTGLDGI